MSAQKRDQNYFMKEIAIHESDIHNFVRSKIGEPTLTDDITQLIMEKAWEKRDTLQDEDKAKAWLMQIASHAIIDYFRMLKTKRKYEYDHEEGNGEGQASGEEERQRMEQIKSEEDEAITILMAAEDSKIIVKAFKMLPPMDQKLLTMFYVLPSN